MFSGFVLLDLAAGFHEILYLRTRWWWLGEALGVWNTAAVLTQHKYLWSLTSASLFAPKLTCTSSPIENFDRSDASRILRPWKLFSPSPFQNYAPLGDVARFALTRSKICVRRRLGPKTNFYWLSLTLQVSNAYSCNRKFPGDYKNEVNILFPGTFPIVELTPLAPDSRLMEHQFSTVCSTPLMLKI
jgi:hypothetical protein